MEINLGETQKQILSSIAQSKQVYEQEYQKLLQREQELVASILEAKGIDLKATSEIKVDGSKIIFVYPENEDVKVKKLKK